MSAAHGRHNSVIMEATRDCAGIVDIRLL